MSGWVSTVLASMCLMNRYVLPVKLTRHPSGKRLFLKIVHILCCKYHVQSFYYHIVYLILTIYNTAIKVSNHNLV